MATLLYTEAAALALRRGQQDVADESLAEARALSDHLSDQAFRCRWRLAVGYELQGYVLLSLAERYFEECVKAADRSSPAAAQALLATGSIHEINSIFEGLEHHGPAAPTSAESLGLPEFLRRAHLEQESKLAEESYKKAIKTDPALVEAHLRLGRVWQRQGRGADARRELQWVLQNSRDSYLLSMAHIFLGTLEETLKHAPEAVTQFQAAVDLEPRAQSARLGLSFAQRANGQAAASQATVRLALERPARGDPSPGDPWLSYHLGLYRLFEPTLRELREGGTR
jgi:tetratricopeptide (TPR) repeat protein